MPRFAILTHDHPFPHWDLLLEWDGALRSWRLDREPDSQGMSRATGIPDHRLYYLEYEGPISNGRGEVRQWDAGSFTIRIWSNEQINIELAGSRLYGRGSLIFQSESEWKWEFYAY